ncbi:hypothetical protein BM1374165_01531 [Bartonella henselae]|uniref:Uncharacterized protein n=1 Tax=Bartonella henselae TaxID=38323 RepID=X5MGP5_BARHN|nr:hypothetical protein BM1374165_01531 [Bartonella henselae]
MVFSDFECTGVKGENLTVFEGDALCRMFIIFINQYGIAVDIRRR